MKVDIEEFEKLEISEDLLPHIRQVAISNRVGFIKRINGLVAAFKVPPNLEFEEVRHFYDSTMPLLNNTRERIRKHLRYFRGVSKHGVLEKNLKGVEVLKHLLESLGNTIEDNKGILLSVEKSRNLIGRITELRKPLKDKESTLRLEGEVNQAKDYLLKTDRKIKLLMENAEWQKFTSYLKMEEKVKSELKEVSDEIVRNISPLNKSFKKFEKLLDKEQDMFEKRASLELYARSPIDAIEQDTDLEDLNLILKLIKTCIETGRLELKSEKQEKTLTQIRNIQESDRLRSLVTKFQDLKQQQKTLKKDLSKMAIQKEKNLLNEKKKEIESKIRNLTTQIEEIATSKKGHAKQISNLILSLEESLRTATGKEVKIYEEASPNA